MMIDRTTDYAKLVVSGKRPTGRSEYLACQRHMKDMEREDFPYYFDVKAAERAIQVMNALVIGEGKERTRLKTRGFQNFIIGSLMGWKKKDTGERRFREAYCQMGRQNGKSFLSAGLGNYFATFGGYQFGRIFCTATKQDQANIVWTEIEKFILSDPDLADLYKVTEYKHEIKSLVTGTVIRAIGRDTKSADGFRSILAIVDEYHAHPNDQMYKLMLDGQIRVDSALTIAITTAGFNLNSPCYQQYQFCKKILAGAIEKESQFVYIAEMDENDDPMDPRNWIKANPLNLWKNDIEPDSDMISRMQEKAISAKEKGGADLLNFLTKSLNQWVTYTGGALVDAEKWAECAADSTLEDMRGRSCYLGIDLSSGGDLTSIALLFPLENDRVYIYSHSFMPSARLLEHEKTDEAPYRVWVNEGLLTLTDGSCGVKTDYKYIISFLQDLIQKYGIRIQEVGYDPHNAAAFLEDLDFLGCDLTEITQSARSLSDSTVDFKLSVKAGMVSYDRRNALLTWSVLNAVETSNSFGEIKIDKQQQTQRIDPVDAVVDAWKLYFLSKQTEFDVNQSVEDWLGLMEDRP